MGKKSAPPAPDYPGAAQAQGAANKETAIAEAQLGNPNITNPYGQQSVSYQNDPLTGNPVPYVTQSLSPVGQQRFQQDERINTGLGGIAERGLGYVGNQLNQPFDQSQLPQQQVNAGETGQQALLSRIEPQIQQDREALRTQLYNQGISEGSGEAWGNAWRPQVQRENDLRLQAASQGIGIGNQARQQGIQEQSYFRNEPLNMLNAVRSASPINIPQFQNYQGANMASAPLFNAAQAQGQFDINRYGIQQGGANNMMGGLFGIGTALAGRNWG